PASAGAAPPFPPRRSSDLVGPSPAPADLLPRPTPQPAQLHQQRAFARRALPALALPRQVLERVPDLLQVRDPLRDVRDLRLRTRSEEHTSELQSRENLVCR